VFFFIFLALYNFILVVFAVSLRLPWYSCVINVCAISLQLKFRNITEVYSFLVVNALIMVYAFFQVYQFRGFGEPCDAVTMVGYMALANVSVSQLCDGP
jgi:hypothetical protein